GTWGRVEFVGLVLVASAFLTPAEAVELANNTPYGLAASIWTENVNLALDIARKIKAGVVWINSTNVFDAASGFGGYRESGFGREGGKEGLYEYIKPQVASHRSQDDEIYGGTDAPAVSASNGNGSGNRRAELETQTSALITPPIDRTPKHYIGGKQARPDSGYSRPVYDACGHLIGEVGDGNRKDIRNAVEAARAAAKWADQTAHNRAQ